MLPVDDEREGLAGKHGARCGEEKANMLRFHVWFSERAQLR